MYGRLLLMFAALSMVAGCGGGGGSSSGGSSGYTGVTTQAVVTSANAKALSADAYTGGQLSASAAGVAKDSAGSSGEAALLQQASAILRNSVAIIVGSSPSVAKVVAATVQDTVYGYSGSFSFSITYDQVSGAFSGSITFFQYREVSTSPLLSGSISFSGTYDQATGSFTSLTISMSGLTGVAEGRSFGLAGSVSFSTFGASESVSMSVVLTDMLTGLTYWVKDYALVLTGTSLTLSGTYYDPVHGYVIISTITPLTVAIADSMPTSGQLLFSGQSGTKARLTFTGSGYIVEVDATGTGTYVVVP